MMFFLCFEHQSSKIKGNPRPIAMKRVSNIKDSKNSKCSSNFTLHRFSEGLSLRFQTATPNLHLPNPLQVAELKSAASPVEGSAPATRPGCRNAAPRASAANLRSAPSRWPTAQKKCFGRESFGVPFGVICLFLFGLALFGVVLIITHVFGDFLIMLVWM